MGREGRGEADADSRGRGSGDGHAARGLGFRPRFGCRQEGRSLGPSGPNAPQPRLYPGLRDRPLCVPTPAPEAPQPSALSSLIGSADGFIDWLPNRPLWYASSLPHVVLLGLVNTVSQSSGYRLRMSSGLINHSICYTIGL